MVDPYGRGPEGARCGDCRFQIVTGRGSRRYFKCRKRGITHGAATDIRLKWNACGLFVKKGADGHAG